MSAALTLPEIEAPMANQVQNLDLEMGSIDETSTLQPAAPFAAGAIEALTAKARDRRTLLLSTLTGIRERIRTVRTELEALEMQEYQKQEEVKNLENWIDTCDALGTLSNIVEPLIRHSPTPPKGFTTSRATEEYGFTAKECLRIFTAEPGVTLDHSELRTRFGNAKMPLTLVSQRTNYLLGAGKLTRVGEGLYKLKQAEEAALPEPVLIPRGKGRPRFESKPAAKPKVKPRTVTALGSAPRQTSVAHAAL